MCAPGGCCAFLSAALFSTAKDLNPLSRRLMFGPGISSCSWCCCPPPPTTAPPPAAGVAAAAPPSPPAAPAAALRQRADTAAAAAAAAAARSGVSVPAGAAEDSFPFALIGVATRLAASTVTKARGAVSSSAAVSAAGSPPPLPSAAATSSTFAPCSRTSLRCMLRWRSERMSVPL